MTKLFNWLITSSADPLKTSMMLKALLTMIFGQLFNMLTTACTIGFYCSGLDMEYLTQIAAMVQAVIFYGLSFFGAIYAIVGALRKVRLNRWSAAKKPDMFK